MSEHPRTDGVMEAGAQWAILPPPHVALDPGDMQFFASIVAERALTEWTAHQLELAAMLARAMADMERAQRLMREEGAIAFTASGMPIANPRRAVVQMNGSMILAFRRSLALNARAQGGEARDIGARRAAVLRLEADVAVDDDLLARPDAADTPLPAPVSPQPPASGGQPPSPAMGSHRRHGRAAAPGRIHLRRPKEH